MTTERAFVLALQQASAAKFPYENYRDAVRRAWLLFSMVARRREGSPDFDVEAPRVALTLLVDEVSAAALQESQAIALEMPHEHP